MLKKPIAFSNRTGWNRVENALTEVRGQWNRAGAEILDLTRSNPTECGFRYEEPVIRSALSQEGLLRYQADPRGLVSAREAVCAYYAGWGARIGTGDLCLTSGTSEGYSFLLRLLCNPGDEVLVPAPGYPLLNFLADLCDVKLRPYTLVYDHGWQLDMSALLAATTERTRAVVVVHPNNPTGQYTKVGERERLQEFCAQRGVAIICDEVFLDFGLDKEDRAQRRSFAESDATLTFVLSGISKICGLPQMKLAWIVVKGPEEQKREASARLEVIADSYLSVGTPVQLAAAELLGTRAGFQAQAKTRIRANLRKLDEQLSLQKACGRLVCEGGWSAVLRVPAVQSDEELAVALLKERGVYVHPGHFYEFATAGHMVVSLIVPEDEFADGVRRVLAHFG